MKNYPEIKFGMHKGTRIDEIPMGYLIWLFPGLRFKKKDQPLFKEILRFFLSKDIRVEGKGPWNFYFNDYHNPAPGGGERPFMSAHWRMKNSDDQFVYEVGSHEFPSFIELVDGNWGIANKYVAYKYKFGGLKMVYEINPEYYFFDGLGRIMRGAFLMRRPWIPDGTLSGDFSKNLPIERLDKQNRNHYKTF
jgi:hypothetical protein